MVLALLLVACALAVVSARHQARKLFMALQAEEARTRSLDIEWGRLQLEQSTWAMHARVEQVAREQLAMGFPTPDRIQVLDGGTARP